MGYPLSITTLLPFSSVLHPNELGRPYRLVFRAEEVVQHQQLFEGAVVVAELIRPKLTVLQIVQQQLEVHEVGILPDASVDLPRAPALGSLDLVHRVQFLEKIGGLQAVQRVADDPIKLVIVIQDVNGLGVVHEVFQFLHLGHIVITAARSAHLVAFLMDST